MVDHRRIYLVGPMGAGKSTVGKVLAQRLGMPFIDSDTEIEQRTGADIPWIFEIEGEAGFRRREADVIADLVTRSPLVMATGGGVIMDPKNRTALSHHGFVVYLNASVREQVRRTGKDRGRPLLAGKDRAQVLADLMDVRDALYREVADVVVSTDNKSASALVARIIGAIEQA